MFKSSQISNKYPQYSLPLYSGQKLSQPCQQCGLEFDSIPQLLNHRRRFCQNSGYDNLTGLLMKETGRNDLKMDYKMKEREKEKEREKKDRLKQSGTKIKNYGQYSLSKIQPMTNDLLEKKSLGLYDDIMGLQKHKNQLQSIRSYQYGSRMFGSDAKLEEKTKDSNNKLQYPPRVNPLSSSKSVASFTYRLDEQHFAKDNNKNTEQLQKLLLNNQKSISPATNVHQRIKNSNTNVKEFAEQNPIKYSANPASQQFKLQQLAKYPSILHKSDASIENMPQEEKITYAMYKLDQLGQIKQLYFENGGQSKQFKKNIESMIDFYERLLKDCRQNDLRISSLSIASRPETPIMKLNEIDNKQRGGQNNRRKLENMGVQQHGQTRNNNSNSKNAINFPPGQLPAFSSMPIDPNYLMAQNYAQLYYTKMMQDTLKSRTQQNRKLIEALIKGKSQQQITKGPIKQNPPVQQQKYRFSNQVDITTPSQDRILKLLQEQQLDELKLISKLPINLQDQKLQSIIKNSQLRFKIQKQVLKQKLQKLSHQQKWQSFEQQRQLKNHDWIGGRNKDVIKTQVNHYLTDFSQEFRPQ